MTKTPNIDKFKQMQKERKEMFSSIERTKTPTLSEKVVKPKDNSITQFTPFIYTKDIQEAVKRLKADLSQEGEINAQGDGDSHMIYMGDVLDLITKHFGEELSK